MWVPLAKDAAKISTLSYVDSMMPDSDMALYAALDNEDPTEESFEQLFEKMRLMKCKDYISSKTVPPRLERNSKLKIPSS